MSKKDEFIEAYKNKDISKLKDKLGRINSNAIRILKKELNLTEEEIYKNFYNVENKCLKCGKPTKLINFKKGFQDFCSLKCSNQYYSKQVKEKYKQTCIEKYGVENHTQKDIQNTLKQNEIYEFIKENYNGEIIVNTKNIISPYELDIYIPEFNFAIEYDGIFFHSIGKHNFFKNIDKKYHLMKTELCEDKNIHLFHIFSNEWLNPKKQDIWKSKILIKLHSNKIKKLDARKCIIKEIDYKTSKEFLENNHLQGYTQDKIRYGLFYNNELVSVMTFGKSRFDKNIEYELLRFSSKINHKVIGGASKLLKYFERNYKPKSIISYANRRWSKGNLYEKLGFEFIKNTNPNYFYYKDRKLYNRLKFQKHKLKDLLENFDENKTEYENMLDNNYRIIFDCGQKVYIKYFK